MVEEEGSNIEVGTHSIMTEVTIEGEVIMIIILIIATRDPLPITIKEVADSTSLKLKITFTEGEEEVLRTT